MKKLPVVFASILLLTSAALFIGNTHWKATGKDYSVTFKGGKLEGFFGGLESSITLDDAKPASNKITASIDAASINTGNGMRDDHAKSENALDAAKYPKISFESENVVKKGNNYTATGNLTMKGVTKPQTIVFEFVPNGDAALLNGSFTVAPKDFGVERGGTPETVTITLKIPYSK